MNNQERHWNEIYDKGNIKQDSRKPTAFALEVMSRIPQHSQILELGCGTGVDSVGFAKQGHIVTATDFSEIAIAKNKERFVDSNNLTFNVLDISQPFPFSDSSFTVVYARLSLHYFTDKDTKRIFAEIGRVLQPDGCLSFLCKSTEDPLYNKGKKIEPDMYEYNGHVRHFFTRQYAIDCLGSIFIVDTVETGRDIFYENESGFVKVIARKKVGTS